jgi:hypothetical protein
MSLRSVWLIEVMHKGMPVRHPFFNSRLVED